MNWSKIGQSLDLQVNFRNSIDPRVLQGPYQASGGYIWPPWGQSEPHGATAQRKGPGPLPTRTRHQSSGTSSTGSELLQNDKEYYSASEENMHGRSVTPSGDDIRKIKVDSFAPLGFSEFKKVIRLVRGGRNLESKVRNHF